MQQFMKYSVFLTITHSQSDGSEVFAEWAMHSFSCSLSVKNGQNVRIFHMVFYFWGGIA